MADEPEPGRDEEADEEPSASSDERTGDGTDETPAEERAADDGAEPDEPTETDETDETGADGAGDGDGADESGDSPDGADENGEDDIDHEKDIWESNLQPTSGDRDDDAGQEGEADDAADDPEDGESDDGVDQDLGVDTDFPVAGMTAEEAAGSVDEEDGEDGMEFVEDASIEDNTEVYEPEVEDEVVGVEPEKQEIDEGIWGEGPDSDEEMPLADHIEEMMRRLAVVFLFGGTVTLAVLGLGQVVEAIPDAVEIIDFLWNHNIPGAPEMQERRPRVYGPLELILTKLKVAGLAGLLVGLPVFVYETYLFMRPGLYPTERRYYLAAVPTSLILGAIGMAFAHFLLLPVIFDYFTFYTQETAFVAFGLAETFNLILLLMGYMAIVFQIPLFIMLAIMMNLVTRLWLEDKRLLFWGAFAGLAFLVSPDPTGMAPIIVAATMIVLFEGTLALLRWTGN